MAYICGLGSQYSRSAVAKRKVLHLVLKPLQPQVNYTYRYFLWWELEVIIIACTADHNHV